jgi:hypothetical protein
MNKRTKLTLLGIALLLSTPASIHAQYPPITPIFVTTHQHKLSLPREYSSNLFYYTNGFNHQTLENIFLNQHSTVTLTGLKLPDRPLQSINQSRQTLFKYIPLPKTPKRNLTIRFKAFSQQSQLSTEWLNPDDTETISQRPSPQINLRFASPTFLSTPLNIPIAPSVEPKDFSTQLPIPEGADRLLVEYTVTALQILTSSEVLLE